jgi:hypothetical protein
VGDVKGKSLQIERNGIPCLKGETWATHLLLLGQKRYNVMRSTQNEGAAKKKPAGHHSDPPSSPLPYPSVD